MIHVLQIIVVHDQRCIMTYTKCQGHAVKKVQYITYKITLIVSREEYKNYTGTCIYTHQLSTELSSQIKFSRFWFIDNFLIIMLVRKMCDYIILSDITSYPIRLGVDLFSHDLTTTRQFPWLSIPKSVNSEVEKPSCIRPDGLSVQQVYVMWLFHAVHGLFSTCFFKFKLLDRIDLKRIFRQRNALVLRQVRQDRQLS